jgi:hypothetical protein
MAYVRHAQADRDKNVIARCAIILIVAAFLFLTLFFFHGATLAQPPVQSGQGVLLSAAETVFSTGFLPQWRALVQQALLSPHLVIMLFASPFLWRRRFRSTSDRVAMTGFLSPLAALLFYRNSYPYFFVFILAPVSITLLPIVELLLRRLNALLIGAILTAYAALFTLAERKDVITTQRQISGVAHQLFPAPITYIDFCGMLGDYPRALPFLTSGWGMQHYRQIGIPLLSRALERTTVPLLLVNDPIIAAALEGTHPDLTFLPTDNAALRNNFIPHWGPVWVAGKRIPAGDAKALIKIMIPGRYTVENASLEIDGRRLGVGDTVTLTRGGHIARSGEHHEALLRWGDHLPIPAIPVPTGPIYTQY